MSGFKDKLEDRRQTAAKALKAMQERFAQRPGPDDPAIEARRAERQAVMAAREIRRAELEEKRQKDREREAEQAARIAAEEQQRREQEARDAQASAEREAALKLEQKAARDARYAARKARGS
jgi:hypothetical protein